MRTVIEGFDRVRAVFDHSQVVCTSECEQLVHRRGPACKVDGDDRSRLRGELALDVGDVVVLYTDGITEAFNDAGEDFGELRLIDALRRCRDEFRNNRRPMVAPRVFG